MKYVKAAAGFITSQLTNPDDDFVRLVGRQIYDGSLTKNAVEMLRSPIQAALDEVIRNRIQDRLNVTFGKEVAPVETEKKVADHDEEPASDVITTEDEMMSFLIVRAIAARKIDPSRITIRDAKSWCSIFVDDNNRKPLCRLYFNAKNSRSIGLFDASKAETRHVIAELVDIYQHAETIEVTASAYV